MSSTSTSTSTRGRCRQGAEITSPHFGTLVGCCCSVAASRCAARRRGGLLEVLEAELQLVRVEPLRPPTELPALQLPDQEA